MTTYYKMLILMAVRYAAANQDDMIAEFQNEFDGDADDDVCRVTVGEETELIVVPADETLGHIAGLLEAELIQEFNTPEPV